MLFEVGLTTRRAARPTRVQFLGVGGQLTSECDKQGSHTVESLRVWSGLDFPLNGMPSDILFDFHNTIPYNKFFLATHKKCV